MMMPLETLYHGVYFRSRTEARFAVFLDCIGIKWEYEPQGFNLGDNLNYLPDFKIYNVSTYHCNGFITYDYMWVEVKGMWDDNHTGKLLKPDFEKIMKFAFDDTFDGDCWGREVKNPIWVVGNTQTLDLRNEQYIYGDTDWGPGGLINNFITIDGDSYGFVLACPKKGELILCGRDSNYLFNYMKYHQYDKRMDLCCDNILEALEEANRYKFDHGNQYKIASCLLHDYSEKENLEKLKAKEENDND